MERCKPARDVILNLLTNAFACWLNSARDTQSLSDIYPFAINPPGPYRIHAGILSPYRAPVDPVGPQLYFFNPYPSNTGAPRSTPSHEPFLRPRSCNTRPSVLSVPSQSMNAGISPSVGRGMPDGLGIIPFVDSSPSQQRFTSVGYESYNDHRVSILSQVAHSSPNFTATTIAVQVPQHLSFQQNSGTIQEIYGTYVSSRVNQSPVPFHHNHLLDTGVSGLQDVLASVYHRTFTEDQ
jgi:hypothetical protein